MQELGALGPSPANKPPLDDLNASGRVTKTIEESYSQNKGHPTKTNEKKIKTLGPLAKLFLELSCVEQKFNGNFECFLGM